MQVSEQISATSHQIAGHARNWRSWLRAGLSGFIRGGATAVSSVLTVNTAHTFGVDVPVLNWKATGMIFVAAGAQRFFTWWKDNPIPNDSETAPDQ